MSVTRSFRGLCVCLTLTAPLAIRADAALAQDAAATQARIAALKQSLADGQKRLRQYEWIETTAMVVANSGHRPLAR